MKSIDWRRLRETAELALVHHDERNGRKGDVEKAGDNWNALMLCVAGWGKRRMTVENG